MPAYVVTLPTTGRFTLPGGVTDVVVFANSAADAKAMAKARVSGDSDAAWDAATATEVTEGTDFSDGNWNLNVVVRDTDGTIVTEQNAAGGVGGITGVAIDTAGSSYAADDTLTVAGGTFTRAATIRVTTVSSGAITGVEVIDPGEYTVAPSLSANSVTGGSGSGAALDLTYTTDAYGNFFAEMVGLLNATDEIAAAAVDLGEGGIGSSDLTFTVAAGSDAIGDHTVEAEFRNSTVPVAALLGAVTDEGSGGDALEVTLIADASLVVPAVVAALKDY